MYQDKGVFRLDKIKIYNYEKTKSITMPRIKDITVGAEEESKKTTMASAKIVKDVIGYRPTVSASWDYVPASTIAELINLIRQGTFLWVEYPSPTGDAAGYFDIEYPSCNVFCYKNGVAVWHNVSLDMTAQEVV